VVLKAQPHSHFRSEIVRAEQARGQVGKARVMLKAAENSEDVGKIVLVVCPSWWIQWVKRTRSEWTLGAGRLKFLRDY